ncbi:outer membrane beta-barrel protein, partial [Kaarinaea lacus]
MKLFKAGFLFLLLLPFTANANGTYFQVDLVSLALEGKPYFDPGYSYDASPTGLGFKGGIRFNPNLAVEGSIVLGLSDDNFDYSTLDVGVSSIVGVYGVANLPISRYADIYAKLGMANVSYEDEDGDKIDGSGLSYGFGTAFYVGPGMMVLEF